MPGVRTSMRKIREVLRLRESGLTVAEIARSLGIAAGTAWTYATRLNAAGLTWPLPPELDDAALERLVYPPPPHSRMRRPEPDWPAIHRELEHPGVMLLLVWEEYRATHPDGYGYSRFCQLYRAWQGKLGDHAPASSGGREAVRRLRRPDRCGDRSGHRYDAGGADLRRRHGGVQLHLRRGGLDPEPRRLDRRARPGVRVSEWRTARRRAGQPQGGDRAGLSLRAGRRSDVRRHGRSLRHGHSPGPACQTARQGEGGGRRAGRRAVDPGAAEKPPLLLARRAERGDRRATRALNRAKVMRHLGATRQQLFDQVDRPALKDLPAEAYVFAEWRH